MESKNQDKDIEAALDQVKKERDYLFETGKTVPRVVSSTPGINENTDDKKTKANQALRGLLGKNNG